MKLLRNYAWLVCLALFTACGDDGPPTAPGPTGINVTGSDLVLVGNSETFVAAGNTGGLTAPRWGSDAPTVATVDAGTGLVTAVGRGLATIFVDANGLRGTRLIRVVPNFGGDWSGSYTMIECQSTADPTFCSWNPPGATNPLSMSFTQSRDIVLGSFQFEGQHNVSGTVSPEGILSFDYSYYTLFGSLRNIRFESTQPGHLTGTFEEVWPDASGGQALLAVFQLVGVSRK